MSNLAKAVIELTKLAEHWDNTVWESPGGGGEEFVDHSNDEWKMTSEALKILKGLGFKSFRDFSEQLASATGERYVERLVHSNGYLCIMPIRTSFSDLSFEISVKEANFDAMEAAFKDQLYVYGMTENGKFEDFTVFFKNNGAAIVSYKDFNAASCSLRLTIEDSTTGNKTDPERLWVGLTKHIKVVRP
jgi:uncharacterized protein with von Willebrand factor type A (vWA) domain